MKKLLLLILLNTLLFFTYCVKKVELKESLPEYSELKEYELTLSKGEYSLAIEQLDGFIKRYPRSPLVEEALFFAGYALFKLEKHDKAERYFMEVLRRFPGSEHALKATTFLAILALEKGDYGSARQMFEPLRNNEKVDRAQIEYLLGEVFYYLKDYMNALLSFRESFIHFTSPELKENVRTVLKELIIPSLSTGELKVCAEYFPKDFPGAECMIKLATESLKGGKVEEALRYSGDLLKYFPENENAEKAEEILEIIEGQKKVKIRNIGIMVPLGELYKNPGWKVIKGCLHSAGIFSDIERRNFTITVADSGDNPTTAEKAIDKLVREYNVSAVVGPLLPATAYSAATRAEILRVPILLLTNIDKLNEIGDYTFSFGLTASVEARAIARYAIQELNLRKFAILYPDSDFGRSEMNAFWDEVEKYGGKIVGIESYEPEKKEFTSEIKKLVGLYYLDTREEERRQWLESIKDKTKKNKRWSPPPIVDFEALFIPSTPDKASIILLYLPYYDIISPIPLGVSAWHNRNLLAQAKKEAEGSVFPDIFAENSDRPEVRYFVETFMLSFNEEPDRYSALGFDACNLIIKTVEEGASSRDEMRDELLKIKNHPGVTGILNFNDEREAERNIIIFKIKNGKIEIVKDGFNQ